MRIEKNLHYFFVSFRCVVKKKEKSTHTHTHAHLDDSFASFISTRRPCAARLSDSRCFTLCQVCTKLTILTDEDGIRRKAIDNSESGALVLPHSVCLSYIAGRMRDKSILIAFVDETNGCVVSACLFVAHPLLYTSVFHLASSEKHAR